MLAQEGLAYSHGTRPLGEHQGMHAVSPPHNHLLEKGPPLSKDIDTTFLQYFYLRYLKYLTSPLLLVL